MSEKDIIQEYSDKINDLEKNKTELLKNLNIVLKENETLDKLNKEH